MLMRNDCCAYKRTESKSHVLVAEESTTGRHRVEKSILFQYFWCKRETTVNELVRQRCREYKEKRVYKGERETRKIIPVLEIEWENMVKREKKREIEIVRLW